LYALFWIFNSILVEQFSNYLYTESKKKERFNRRNFLAHLFKSWDRSNSSLEVTILNYLFPIPPNLVIHHCHWSCSIKFDSKNISTAVRISLSS